MANSHSSTSRVLFLVALLIALSGVALAVVGLPYVRRLNEERMARVVASAAAARAERKAVVLDVAPVPLPTALPLRGPPERDADGYPLAYVDRAGFRSLLMHGEHEALNRYFDELQTRAPHGLEPAARQRRPTGKRLPEERAPETC